jgi:hypothetical protein
MGCPLPLHVYHWFICDVTVGLQRFKSRRAPVIQQTLLVYNALLAAACGLQIQQLYQQSLIVVIVVRVDGYVLGGLTID